MSIKTYIPLFHAILSIVHSPQKKAPLLPSIPLRLLKCQDSFAQNHRLRWMLP